MTTTVTLPQTADDIEAARQARMPRALDNAWRSPFFARKLEAAGVRRGEVPSDDVWHAIEPTTKDELRKFSAQEYNDELVIAGPSEIATYWRSGGVTGRPLFYPRAHVDLPDLVESFARVLDLVGLTRGDLVHNSFPYMGVHPIGHMFGLALRERGCGNIHAGAGANTPSDVQVELIHTLAPSAWMGIGSYIIHLGHRAEALGYDPARSTVRRLISSAEPLTPAKRRRMEDLWGAELFDVYGMTECSLMGGECDRHDGLHVWTDQFLVEICDPETWKPLPAGEVGSVVVTPLHNTSALPFVRWVSGDVGSLEHGCSCPYSPFPRLKLAARTVGFTKVRGININHNDFEDLLLSMPGVADYMVTVATVDFADRLQVELECGPSSDPEAVVTALQREVSTHFELQPDITLLERGTVAKRLESQVKQIRFRDERASQAQ